MGDGFGGTRSAGGLAVDPHQWVCVPLRDDLEFVLEKLRAAERPLDFAA